MIISPNKFKTSTCWQKVFNRYHLRLQTPRNLTLSEGAAFHSGVAKGLATKDWDAAKAEARKEFAQLASEVPLLPEQEFQLKDFGDLLNVMIDKFAQEYKDDDYQVVQPECEFDVELPNSMHNCIWTHWVDKDGFERWTDFEDNEPRLATSRPLGPPAIEIEAGQITSPHRQGPDPDCKCWQPHRLMGFTDALIAKNRAFWLQDHKTTAMANEQFWSQWHLDWAMTAYVYGVWKSTGVRPHGFYINAMLRPSEKQVAAWNSKRKDPRTMKSVADYVAFSREAFLRDDKDLARFEKQAIHFANEWEWRILGGGFDMKPGATTCTTYNRKCDFYEMCLTHGEDRAGLVQLTSRERKSSEAVVEI